jgi:N-acetylmuramoyl-L-alanine amidase
VYVAAAMLSRPPALSLAVIWVSLAVPSAVAAQTAQAAPSLPPIPAVDGPVAVHVVYPLADSLVAARDSSFLFGSVGSGRARLTIDGTPVAVAPNGAFLAWLPLPDDSVAVFHLVATRDGERDALDWRVRLPRRFVPPDRPLWTDAASIRPRGLVWARAGEPLRVSVRASPGASVAVRLPDGRVFPLAPDTTPRSPYGPFERQPDRLVPRRAVRFTGDIPAVPLGAPLPALTVPVVPAAPRDSSGVAAVVVAAGADTEITALPVRVTLVRPQALAVVILAAEAGRGAVVGSPTPGGTYHWFFPDGTPAQLDGRRGGQVRVRLSAASTAWVSVGDVATVLPPGTPEPATTVRLVRLTPRDSSVEARFSLRARVPFRVDEDDRAITVRLYGAAGDLDFVQYGGTDSLVRRVSWAQPASDECTVTFELTAPVFGWRTRWDGEDLVLQIRRPPPIDPVHPLAGRTIAVDPGHPPLGATGPTGLREADANLAVALALRDQLEGEGARVVMTRTADTALGLYERVAIAEQADADVLVSIHNNAFPDGVNPLANDGTSTYYFYPRAARLALLTQRALVSQLGLRDLGIGLGDLALVRVTWMPAILTEGAFLMIPAQENALRTPAFQEAYARGIAQGLAAYLRELAAPEPGP